MESKPIYAIDKDGKVEKFNSRAEAADAMYGKTRDILAVLDNPNRTAYGRHWKSSI